MDLETENRIAAILLKEAAEMRRRAEKEGIHVYLEKPQVRGRPNSRFLASTVLGVQQANRAVEVNEMWRAREKEIELNDRLKGRSRRDDDRRMNDRDVQHSSDGPSTRERHTSDSKHASTSSSSSKMTHEHVHSPQPDGLKDAEIEEFLHSRVKRGRGTVGSRMDETGPYLPSSADHKTLDFERREHRVALGPEKPVSLKSPEYSEDETEEDKPKKARKLHSSSSDQRRHSRKHKSKEKSRDKKKKKEKRSKM